MLYFILGYVVLTAVCLGWVYYKIQNPRLCLYDVESRMYRGRCYEPLLAVDEMVDMKVYVGISSQPPATPIWSVLNVPLNEPLTANINVPIPPAVRLNGTELNCWISVNKAFDTRQNDEEGEGDERTRQLRVSGITNIIHHTALTSMNVPRVHQRRNLLGSKIPDEDRERENQSRDLQRLPHWKYGAYPLTMRLVHFDGVVLGSTFLDVIGYRLYTRIVPQKRVGNGGRVDQQAKYEPIVFVDETSLLRNHLAQISRNVSRPPATLHFKYQPTSPVVFSFKVFMKQAFEMLGTTAMLGEAEIDEIKYWISDDRIYRFFLTQAIGLIHMILEYLAFRGDWKFFVGRRSFAGLSVSSLAYSVVRSFIIFLYLLDADTSTIIMLGLGKDILWSAWKLYKVIRSQREAQTGSSPAAIEDIGSSDMNASEAAKLAARKSDGNGKLSSVELQRLASWCDNYATIHVGLCVYPLVVGTALHSMLYSQHKSWWSWFISSMADSVYLFGFVSMTPQLYINYKLKSVAHLPLSAFVYKMFNTFIDDVFAFMIKMPWKHRLMTFRDDVVFLGFLYQWWIYRIDKSRPNEYGFMYEEEGDNEDKAKEIEMRTDAPVEEEKDSKGNPKVKVS